MLITQSLVAGISLAAAALASSCEGSFVVTPVSVEVKISNRTGHHLSHPVPLPDPCPERVLYQILVDGNIVNLIDTNCDGHPDVARSKNQQWEIQPVLTPRPSDLFSLPDQSLPSIDPGFGNRSAEQWIAALGLDQRRGDTHFQPLWINAISTADWTLDVSLPSSSACRRPLFADFDLGYQWSVLPATKGPDFEVWRVAGDINEVLRYLVACGILSGTVETSAGLLEFEVQDFSSTVSVTLDGELLETISLE